MATTEYLRAGVASGQPVGVDEDAKVIHGYVVAQLGPFKTGRGEFDADGLAAIVRLINAQPDGIVVNYGHHENVGSPDAMDAFLGRAKNARIDRDRVRADLHFNDVAFMSHNGGTSRGERLMQRAKTDPGSYASSLVLAADKRPSKRGQPPTWHPVAIQSSDLVYIGDAVHGGILSANDRAADEELRCHWEELKRKAGIAPAEKSC
jgi:hypothetical protein